MELLSKKSHSTYEHWPGAAAPELLLRARTAAQDRDIAAYQAATEAQENAVSKLQNLQTPSWLLFGVGVAGCAVATYYWLDDAQLQVGVSPSHISFQANF